MGWPKYLKKTYTKEELTKKVLKKVQLKHDREFLESLFHSEKKGAWTLKKDLTKTETARLKKIVKEIKKGKGGLKTLPLLILLILAAGITLFTLFLKNPLIEKVMELSLESLFGATVEIDHLEISLVKTSLELERVAITDETNLERNLIDLGPTLINFNGRALLQKKFVIETLESRNMGWDTLREIPGKPAGDKKNRDGTDREVNVLPFMEEHGGTTINTVSQAAQDPEAFVQNQWDNLMTPAAAQEISAKYEKLLLNQQGKIEEMESTGNEVKVKGQEFLSRDFNRYKDNPAEIPQLVKEADEYKNEVNAASTLIREELANIEAIGRSLQEDKDRLLQLKEDDYNQLRSLISIPEGGVDGIFKGIVQSYIASLLGDKYGKAMTLWGYVQEYRQVSGDKEKSPRENQGRRTGRVVSFESTDWPAFLLQQGLFSAKAGDLSWEIEAHDISAAPEEWKNPITLGLDLKKGEGTLGGEGLIDKRDKGESLSEGQVEFSGLPLTSNAMVSMGISQISGNAGGTTQIRVDNTSWRVDTDLLLSDTELKKEGGDQISNLVYRVLSRDDWKMAIVLEGEGDQFSLGLDWPLLSQIDDEVGALLKDQADEFLDQAEKELTKRFASELKGIEEYTGDLNEYRNILTGDLSSLDKQQQEINRKIEEVKAQAASQASDKTNEILENTGAKDAVENVGDTLKKLF
jgi:uncharacterized protein (TIGR03545 family)